MFFFFHVYILTWGAVTSLFSPIQLSDNRQLTSVSPIKWIPGSHMTSSKVSLRAHIEKESFLKVTHFCMKRGGKCPNVDISVFQLPITPKMKNDTCQRHWNDFWFILSAESRNSFQNNVFKNIQPPPKSCFATFGLNVADQWRPPPPGLLLEP